MVNTDFDFQDGQDWPDPSKFLSAREYLKQLRDDPTNPDIDPCLIEAAQYNLGPNHPGWDPQNPEVALNFIDKTTGELRNKEAEEYILTDKEVTKMMEATLPLNSRTSFGEGGSTFTREEPPVEEEGLLPTKVTKASTWAKELVEWFYSKSVVRSFHQHRKAPNLQDWARKADLLTDYVVEWHQLSIEQSRQLIRQVLQAMFDNIQNGYFPKRYAIPSLLKSNAGEPPIFFKMYDAMKREEERSHRSRRKPPGDFID